ncbi:peptidase G1, partial [Mycena galopus ATCC 62051]
YAPVSRGKQLGQKQHLAHPQYSTNWAGAVLEAPAGVTYNAVSGDCFHCAYPPAYPAGNPAADSAAVWVGIDGYTSTQASILETGIDMTISNGHRPGNILNPMAWYEWFPDIAIDFSGITISAGAAIKVSVNATSRTTGIASIENMSTNQTVSTPVRAPSSAAALAMVNAEWIVEDFEEDGEIVPFADFGEVQFQFPLGSLLPSGAVLLDMEQSGTVLTSASTTGTSVTVTYIWRDTIYAPTSIRKTSSSYGHYEALG